MKKELEKYSIIKIKNISCPLECFPTSFTLKKGLGMTMKWDCLIEYNPKKSQEFVGKGDEAEKKVNSGGKWYGNTQSPAG